ncbi:8830_t:CDS:10, partial [Entrophospora sp. SA101]
LDDTGDVEVKEDQNFTVGYISLGENCAAKIYVLGNDPCKIHYKYGLICTKQEEQHSRLEQKMERAKSILRTSSPTIGSKNKLDELESRNFTLEEEVKDLRIQLSNKQNETIKYQEMLNKRTSELEKTKAEYDEKMKKTRGIFNAANKSLTDLRQTVATKDAEIEELKASLEKLKLKDEKTKTSVDESQKSVERLTTEIHSQTAMYNAQIEQLESKLRQSTQQIAQIKLEFQQYKTRAHALLEQKNLNENSSSEKSELIIINKKLDFDLSLKVNELKNVMERLHLSENNYKRVLELNSNLEKEYEKGKQMALDNEVSIKKLQEIVENLSEENENLRKALRESEENYKSNIEDFQEKFEQSTENVQKNLVKKQEESDELQKNSEQLGEELLRIRAELEARNEQIEELQKQISNNKSSSSPPPSAIRTHFRKDSSRAPSPSSPSSLSGRTSSTHNMEDRKSLIPSSAPEKEKDYLLKLHHMAELLNESESTVQRLMEQERLLKDELRKLDRLEKRQDLSVEYLKNVVLKFFETNPNEREPLISVISTILQLSPEEIKSFKEHALNNSIHSPVVLGFGFN